MRLDPIAKPKGSCLGWDKFSHLFLHLSPANTSALHLENPIWDQGGIEGG